MWQILVFFVAPCAVMTSAVDPGHGGTIVDGYLDNLRTLLRQNDLETIQLPNFDWFPGKSWSILGTKGSLGNLSTVRWTDGATVIENGDVTNILTSLYLPEARVHYQITFFQFIDLAVDIKIITNALKLDLDFNRTDCSVLYNQIDVYYFENLFPKIHLGLLDNPLVPREFADFVETGIAVAIQITNSVFNIIIKPTLTMHASQALTSETQKFNLCPIFELEHKSSTENLSTIPKS